MCFWKKEDKLAHTNEKYMEVLEKSLSVSAEKRKTLEEAAEHKAKNYQFTKFDKELGSFIVSMTQDVENIKVVYEDFDDKSMCIEYCDVVLTFYKPFPLSYPMQKYFSQVWVEDEEENIKAFVVKDVTDNLISMLLEEKEHRKSVAKKKVLNKLGKIRVEGCTKEE